MAGFAQPTLYLEWGGELQLNQNGGLQLATGWDLVRQAIVRSLLTNSEFTLQDGTRVPPDYFFDVDYGEGLGRKQGELQTQQFIDELQQKITNAVLIQEGVDVTRPPDITLRRAQDNTLWITIIVYLKNKTSGKIVFSLSQK